MKEQSLRTAAVILAGGKGLRMGGDTPKQYLLLQGRPLLCHTLDAFEAASCVDAILVVVGAADVDRVRAELTEVYGPFAKLVDVVAGGRERYDSSKRGLDALLARPETYDIVLVHDAARALVSAECIDCVVQKAVETGACVAAVPVTDTVKQSADGDRVDRTLPRKELFAVQTPQGFATKLLTAAYTAMEEQRVKAPEVFAEEEKNITDDASVVERYTDHPVYLAQGEATNRKVTLADDLEFVKYILHLRKDGD